MPVSLKCLSNLILTDFPCMMYWDKLFHLLTTLWLQNFCLTCNLALLVYIVRLLPRTDVDATEKNIELVF